VEWLNTRVRVWPVFLSSTMHHDVGDLFSVGDRMAWDVELIDGRAAGWPWYVLVDVMARIHARPAWALSGALAEANGLRACWRGPERPGTELALSAGLVADLWNPLFHANVAGVVRRIRTVAYAHAQRDDGVWMPFGPRVLEDVEATARWLKTAHTIEDMSNVHEDGLLIDLAITANELKPFD
jgi:hypothetical protein